MTFAIIIFALATFALLSWVIHKMGEVDDRQERLDKFSVHLDERANKLSQWEQELTNWKKEKGDEAGLA